MDQTRQFGTNLTFIRPDHVYRYRFAASKIPEGGSVIDAACGCGYGSRILFEKDLTVTGIDISQEAIDYAIQYYAGPQYICSSIEAVGDLEADYLVSFETVEHLKFPSILKKLNCRHIIASVPNEERYPFRPEIFAADEYPHQRHYRPVEFEQFLNGIDYRVTEKWCQKDKKGPISLGTDGLFLIYVGERIDPFLPVR